MLNILEQECPICHHLFTLDDDIVVCPDCGAPYHRTCWFSNGKCIFENKHGTSDQWQPKPSRNDENTIICGNCGTANLEESKICFKCGHTLNLSNNQPNSYPDSFTKSNVTSAKTVDIYTENQYSEDITAFIGSNSEYYLARFYQIEKQNNRYTWNWGAAFFPVAWLLYRKMFKSFFIIFILMLLLMSPSILNLISNYTAMAGDAQAYQIFLSSGKLPDITISPWLRLLSDASSVMLFFTRLYLAISSNTIYHNFVNESIAKIREKSPDLLQYRYYLSKRGGTNAIGVILFIVSIILLIFLGSILLILYIQ